MRWYGPKDGVRLEHIRQGGADEIVTALHHIPVGEVWSVDEIAGRKQLIEAAGMHWRVVESLPVPEQIKQGKGDLSTLFENYRQSLRNLASQGIEVITYNFMPVLDWVRTDVSYPNPDGSSTLYFNYLAFCFFDLELLKRPGAEHAYSEAQKQAARAYGETLGKEALNALKRTVMLGLPGSDDHFTEAQLLELLQQYDQISDQTLRANLIRFLKEVAPEAERLGLKLAIHPDDPPIPLLGLPRVVSTQEDLRALFTAVPEASNGLCFCTGALGAGAKNSLLDILSEFGSRIHFLHLRNVLKDQQGNFKESPHLEGDVPLPQIIGELLDWMNKRKLSLPMRPDHGFQHEFESHITAYPGYSLMGRMRGLSEIMGLQQGLLHGRI